ncbi:MAG: AraC family transcriptional regulator [Myxococcota bacterium]
MSEKQPTSVMLLWPERVLALAQLGQVAVHAHSASALVMGVDGTFGFRSAEADAGWLEAECVWISAGCSHALDCGPTRMAVLYMAPGRMDHDRFCARHGISPLAPWSLFEGGPGLKSALQAAWEGDLREEALDGWVASVAGDAPIPHMLCGEQRVERAAQLIRGRIDAGWTLDMLASDLNMSPSRLRHLFRASAGISAQQFKIWFRMHAVSTHIAQGYNLTEAAHHAGFVDSAHLSRSFRRLFGLPPSRVLGRGTRMICRP